MPRKYSDVRNMKRAVAFLELKELDHIPWDVYVGYKEIKLTHDHDALDPEDRQKIKGHFPCHTLEKSYESRDYVGTHKVDDDLTIKVKLSRVLTCKKVEPEDLATWTEDDWDDYKAKAMEGAVDVVKCERPERN